ncbi:hypothetical protein AGMMS50276_25840 [Synergistales bacterium]|nr:hypothetical protein AGMMS50276_25840 [Synergistales bacterium]
MRGDAIRPSVLSVRIIPKADAALLESLEMSPELCSLGLITTDCDDVSYAALDEATKKAKVQVAYAKSMYAGSANANTALAGEFLGVIAGSDPEEVRSGLDAAMDFVENGGAFYSANDDDSIVYFAHCVSRTGSYLSKQAKIPEGGALAYLIAPPLEAIFGLDAALKAARVEMRLFYGPPTETNFAGGLLSGDQAACLAACEAFARTVCDIADAPIVTPLALEFLRDKSVELVFRSGKESMPYTPIPDRGEETYIDAQSGEGFSKKPPRMTHLFANQLVPKTHARIALRGKLDTLQGEIIAAQTEAAADGKPSLVKDLGETLSLARELLGAEVMGRGVPPITLFGYSSDELQKVSHHVEENFGFPHPVPDHNMGRMAALLNLLRTKTREVEIAAEHAFPENTGDDILLALNRMSSAFYILLCRLLFGQYER